MRSQIKYFLRKIDEFIHISPGSTIHGEGYRIDYEFVKKIIDLNIISNFPCYRVLLDGVVKIDWSFFDNYDEVPEEYLHVNDALRNMASCKLYCNLHTTVELQFREFSKISDRHCVSLPTWDASEIRKARISSFFEVSKLYLKRIKLFTVGKITSDKNKLEESKAILRINHNKSKINALTFNRGHFKEFNEAPILGTGKCLIILPVYNSLELLKQCIQRIVNYTQNYELVIIDDCSTDKDVAYYLQLLDKQYPGAPIKVLFNEQNLGFVKTVNRGMLEAIRGGISAVIVNSDALVPDDNWLDKMMRPINEQPSKVASVTPLSNAATIMTTPFVCREYSIDEKEIEIINKAASLLSSRYVYPIPAGIGFCMAMNIRFMKLIPQFDIIFGYGYGEEVDWCQKAAAHGGINIGITNLFVAHVGCQSFGIDRKRKAISNAGEIISSRYTSYDAEVQNFIQQDVLAFARIVTGIRLNSSRKSGTKVYIGHNGTGGAQNYLDRKIKHEKDYNIIILRPCMRSCWLLELVDSGLSTSCSVEDNSTVIEVIKDIPNIEVIYSCGVGHPNPLVIPKLISSIKAALDCKISILYHDFFPVNPSYNLLNKKNIFNLSGILDASGKTTWCQLWTDAHQVADEIVVFSKNTENIVKLAYPVISEKIKIVPHDISHAKNTKPVATKEKRSAGLTIGVLGNINVAKGGLLLEKLSNYYRKFVNDIRIVVIGDVDPSINIKKPSIIHGRYEVCDLNSLIDKYEIDLWLFPSIWPETFSYVIHECMITQLPVMCFNLGAQADAVIKYSKGIILNCDYTSTDEANIRMLSDEILGEYEQISTCDDQGCRNPMSGIA